MRTTVVRKREHTREKPLGFAFVINGDELWKGYFLITMKAHLKRGMRGNRFYSELELFTPRKSEHLLV